MPVGLLKGKKAILILTSGGVYSQGPAAEMDHMTGYLKTVLGFIGVTDITVVRAEGLASPRTEFAVRQSGSPESLAVQV